MKPSAREAGLAAARTIKAFGDRLKKLEEGR